MTETLQLKFSHDTITDIIIRLKEIFESKNLIISEIFSTGYSKIITLKKAIVRVQNDLDLNENICFSSANCKKYNFVVIPIDSILNLNITTGTLIVDTEECNYTISIKNKGGC